MISLFRKIRQKLLQQNQFTRYLLYAVGEILLVVIGILIALQVNNWNELRKQRQVEIKYFYNLKNDLLADDERLNTMIDLADSKVKAAKNVKLKADRDSINSLYEFSDEMVTLFFIDEFRPNDNTYEEMKSSGNFSTIRNDNLKLKLMNLKKTYHKIAATQEHMRYDFNVFLEDFEQHVDWVSIITSINPISQKQILSSTHFISKAIKKLCGRRFVSSIRTKSFSTISFCWKSITPISLIYSIIPNPRSVKS